MACPYLTILPPGLPLQGRDGRATTDVPWHKDVAPASCRLRGAAESPALLPGAGKMPALQTAAQWRRPNRFRLDELLGNGPEKRQKADTNQWLNDQTYAANAESCSGVSCAPPMGGIGLRNILGCSTPSWILFWIPA